MLRLLCVTFASAAARLDGFLDAHDCADQPPAANRFAAKGGDLVDGLPFSARDLIPEPKFGCRCQDAGNGGRRDEVACFIGIPAFKIAKAIDDEIHNLSERHMQSDKIVLKPEPDFRIANSVRIHMNGELFRAEALQVASVAKFKQFHSPYLEKRTLFSVQIEVANPTKPVRLGKSKDAVFGATA